MKLTFNRIIILFILCVSTILSCNDNINIELVPALFKESELAGGGNIEIPVSTVNWNIESVQYLPSNENMLDNVGNPLILDGYGSIEAANGWFTLTRSEDDKFTISLRENFDTSAERRFKININHGKYQDYASFIQHAGTEYKMVKSEFEEIETERKIYISDEGCKSLTLSNDTPEAVWEPTDYIFEDVVISSTFESDSYGAFEWTLGDDIEINMPDLIIDNEMYSIDKCVYKEGLTTTSYIKNIAEDNKILVKPFTNIHLRGEITYCKRVYNYTFTIRNSITGTQFEIDGVWTHIAPISKHTISE